MDLLKELLDLILHFDEKLASLLAQYGAWTYGILFLIVFVETGLVIMPLLPGDSLLFTAGMFAGLGAMKLTVLMPLLFCAALLGDNVNYFVGKYFGDHVVNWTFRGRVLVKQEWLDEAHTFFEKHGNKAIIMARFVPIVRTVMPFTCGVAEMTYRKYMTYCVIGAALWVVSMTLLGYFLGGIPVVKEHFEKVVIGIIFVSLLPMLWQFVRLRFGKTS